jgi:hypothetical protein
MSVTTERPVAARARLRPAPRTTDALRPGGDRLALAVLAGLLVVVVALTWRRWGAPELDAGSELTTADLVAHGAVPYDDVRYFYGPLGLYGLAGAFRAFGSSFATAYGFGLVVTVAILGTFYALARSWLRPATAAVATAVLLAIAFSGTAFDFVLPHTSSATVGLLGLLAMLLALSRRRPAWAGVAAGLVCLTRPELAAVAVGAGVAYLVGLRLERRGGVARAALRLAAPAIAIPVVVLGAFAARVGLSNLLTENLWPVDFLRVAGLRTQSDWAPLDLAAVVGLAGRAFVYLLLLGALVATAVRWNDPRLRRSGPIVGALLVLGALDLTLRATGLLADQRIAIETEARELTLGMSWLPALGIGAAIVLFRAWRQRRADSPLGGGWAIDLALTVVALGLGLRAYNAFTPEGSYAAYYAAPLVLLAGILHERVSQRWPAARPVALAALGVVALGLFAHAQIGLYADLTRTVDTPRGSFVTRAEEGAAIEATVQQIARRTPPGQPILAGPADGGLYFMADRPPALAETMLLPGLLDSPADERAAIARLRERGVRLAAIGARDFSAWGMPRFGVDYDRLLGGWLARSSVASTVVGRLDDPAGGTYPSRGFTIRTLAP